MKVSFLFLCLVSLSAYADGGCSDGGEDWDSAYYPMHKRLAEVGKRAYHLDWRCKYDFSKAKITDSSLMAQKQKVCDSAAQKVKEFEELCASTAEERQNIVEHCGGGTMGCELREFEN